MGGEEYGATMLRLISLESGFDERTALVIDGAGGFIQQQHPSFSEQDPREHRPLALAAGKAGLRPIGQRADPHLGQRGEGHLFSLLPAFHRQAQGHALPHGEMKHVWFLGNIGKIRIAPPKHLARVGGQQARDDPEQRAFPAAVFPYKSITLILSKSKMSDMENFVLAEFFDKINDL